MIRTVAPSTGFESKLPSREATEALFVVSQIFTDHSGLTTVKFQEVKTPFYGRL